MNIKGHAVIELKNEETGEVQRIEHDNMLTNGLKYCLTPWLGKYSFANTKNTEFQYLTEENSDIRRNNNASIMNHLLGGIFLFQNHLNENIDNVAFPLDNPLTGKASYNTYNGMDTYRGSYNENESGLQEDGSYKHIWDFTTNQANGQISALALTTYKGGICGCGFKEWNYSTESHISESPYFEIGKIRINTNINTRFRPFAYVPQNAIFYSTSLNNMTYNTAEHLSNSKKIFLKKRKFPLCQISPLYDYYNQYLTEDIELAVPEEFAEYVQGKEVLNEISDSYVYIYKLTDSNGIKPGELIKLLRVRKSDLQVDMLTITNSTPYTLYCERTHICFTDSDCFLFGDGTTGRGRGFYKINIKDNDVSLVSELENAYSLEIINDYLYMSINNANQGYYCYCINTDTLEKKPHPYFAVSDNNWSYNTEKITPNIFLNIKKNFSTYGNYDYAAVCISANTLMTINNLSSPVVKTAAQTMKITYTIQETE